jgi:hypothetical protein
MKTKLRMATVFTGAAACAAAFTPTAAAATTATAPKLLPGNIEEVDCTAADSHWVHLYWLPSSDHGPTCLGYKGTKLVDHWFASFCSGNNYGWISYLSYYGGHYVSRFDTPLAAPSISSPFYVIELHISGYGGNSTCP